jgi:hypothetical protein
LREIDGIDIDRFKSMLDYLVDHPPAHMVLAAAFIDRSKVPRTPAATRDQQPPPPEPPEFEPGA